MNAHILINFHCKYSFALKCLRTVIGQRYKDNQIFVYDDASKPDEARFYFERLVTEFRINCKRSEANGGPAKARFELLEWLKQETTVEERRDSFVFLIDGDDFLIGDSVLSDYGKLFEQDKKFVFGSPFGEQVSKCSRELIESGNLRVPLWFCSPARAFKANLLDEVELQQSMFTVNGEWLRTATDRVLMYELMEGCEVEFDEIGYTDTVNYLYRKYLGSTLGSPMDVLRIANRKAVLERKTDYYV